MAGEKKILVVEDAREDRMRFRHLLPEDSFEFAWAWPKNKGPPGVRVWFSQDSTTTSAHQTLEEVFRSCKRLRLFSMVLLDLAWSSSAERLMRGLQELPVGYGLKLATNKDQERLNKLIERLEGIAFLEWWREYGSDKNNLSVWITSAYTPINARELRVFISERYKEARIFHKWIDESVLKQEIEYFMRVG